MAESYYQVREFAERAGVTVRTLHHYDHLGLLKPTVTTESGYRLYSDRDFARLQQIVTLKFIGLSLRQIKELFDGELYDLATMLRLQRSVMMEKQRRLEQAIQAIDRAERVVAAGDEPTWNLFTRIIEVIEMEPNMDMFKKYFSPEQLSDMEKRYHAEHDSIKQTENDWAELIREVESAMARGEEPGGEHAQGLARRWSELVGRFTMGDQSVQKGLNEFYADEANWSAEFKKPFSDEVQDFITKAMEIGGIRC